MKFHSLDQGAPSSIQFSFNLIHSLKFKNKFQAYIHCIPSICTEPPEDVQKDSLYSQYKTCQSITNQCLINSNQNSQESIFFNSISMKSSDKKNNQQKIDEPIDSCFKKQTRGPIFFQNKSENSNFITKFNYSAVKPARSVAFSLKIKSKII